LSDKLLTVVQACVIICKNMTRMNLLTTDCVCVIVTFIKPTDKPEPCVMHDDLLEIRYTIC